jgi:hypothetical protein
MVVPPASPTANTVPPSASMEVGWRGYFSMCPEIALAGATFLRSSAQIRLRESCGPGPCVIIADTWDSFTLGAGFSIR